MKKRPTGHLQHMRTNVETFMQARPVTTMYITLWIAVMSYMIASGTPVW